MAYNGKLVALFAALILIGCKGTSPTSTSGGADNSSVAAASGGASAGSTSQRGTQVQYINDPSLNMNAISVTFPAGWKFQSVFMQGGTCVPTPYGVFRAASADGWSMVEQMPSLAWQWGQVRTAGYAQKTDCLPMKGPMSAQDFLEYLSVTMNVHYDGPAPIPAAEQAKADQTLRESNERYAEQYAAIGAQQPQTHRELARAQVSYKIGTTAMRGLLDVTVDCTETHSPGQQTLSNWSPGHPAQLVNGPPSVLNKCVSLTRYYTAPAEKLAALVERWDTTGLGPTPQMDWVEAWIKRNQQQTQQMIGQMNAAAAARRQATAEQFAHSMAVQQQMHDQFMQTMQQGHERFMAQQQASTNARSTAASDWVDLALDQQTVINPNTGLASKIPNQVTVEQPLMRAHGDGTPW